MWTCDIYGIIIILGMTLLLSLNIPTQYVNHEKNISQNLKIKVAKRVAK